MSPEELQRIEDVARATRDMDTLALLSEVVRLQTDNARLANENAALVAQLPHGFAFPKDGECRMVD